MDVQNRHENSASWFLRQPHFEGKGNGNSIVFFIDSSSDMPLMPATILMSALHINYSYIAVCIMVQKYTTKTENLNITTQQPSDRKTNG